METHFPNISEAQGQLARDRVMADLRALANDAEALLHSTAEDAGDKAKEMRARLAAAIERAKATYEQVQERAVASAKVAAKQADETIRAHPYESIAVAFGIGLLLGAVLRRK
ncbi:MAG: DUF883 family protein [Opitutaceae bacterium]|nr:DUF883 family protein [Opitutaceae bacterium]